MESDKLLQAVAKALRTIRTSTGYGSVTVTIRLERDPEIETTTSERVAA